MWTSDLKKIKRWGGALLQSALYQVASKPRRGRLATVQAQVKARQRESEIN
jgi:hypothetical protein